MKKILCVTAIISMLLLGCFCIVNASAEDYTLFIDNSRTVFKNVPVQADVQLIGNEAPPFTNVRVKVEVSGPGTPTLMATDSAGQQHDIAQLGYWGPDAGFAVGGTFTNTTPVTATFPEAGLYEIKLSLIDVSQSNATREPTTSNVITESTTNIYVYRDQAEYDEINNQTGNSTTNGTTNNTANNTQAPTNNTTTNKDNSTIEKLPQTGRTITEYVVYMFILIAIIVAGFILIRKNR